MTRHFEQYYGTETMFNYAQEEQKYFQEFIVDGILICYNKKLLVCNLTHLATPISSPCTFFSPIYERVLYMKRTLLLFSHACTYFTLFLSSKISSRAPPPQKSTNQQQRRQRLFQPSHIAPKATLQSHSKI